MKKRSKLLTVFIAATLTFGSLMAFVGPQYSGFNRYGHHGYDGGWHHRHNTHDYPNEHRLPDESNR